VLEYAQEIPPSTTVESHEVAAIFPMMGEDEYARLVASIKANGLREPIWTYQDKIIDGRNRYKACIEAGVEPQYREWDGIGSLVQFVVDLNLERRHLSSTQKAVSALEIEEQLAKEAVKRMLAGKAPDPTTILSGGSGESAHQAGAIVGASGTYVKEAKNIVKQDPDLKAPMKSGALNLQDAKRVVKLPKPERKDIVQRIVSGKSKNVRRAKSAIIREERERLYTEAVVEHDNYKAYHCSVADLKNEVQENSLDAIITDPPYQQNDLPVFSDLAEFAAYALKPGGSLIVMVGKYYLPEIMERLGKHLTYHWIVSYHIPGDSSKQYQRRLGIAWKPLLWFTKGEYTGPWVYDVLEKRDIPVFIGSSKDKTHHNWGQPVADMEAIIEHLTLPDQLICDPFVGAGSTAVAALLRKRRFVGCDIDVQCVQKTKQRIQEAIEGK
jgi:hypothetical protein